MENKANPHTIKKFEIIATYVKSWIEKLMNYQRGGISQCNEICFIDCMCNNGRYIDDSGTIIDGTPIRVARIISDAMKKYPDKKAILYFNDSDSTKINELKEYLPENTRNYQICLSHKNGNDLLKNLRSRLLQKPNVHYLLFYDHYDASIDWTALAPYFFGWGEVILNHVVSDTVRAITSVKRLETKNKYQQTYLTAIEELINLHEDKNAYDKLIENIIKKLGNISNREYYLASFPFFIRTNARIYNIIFFTKSQEGFKLFKTTAWKTFGDKSSNQNTHGKERQIPLLDIEDSRQCYYVSDIVNYIINHFKGQKAVPLEKIWALVDEHPIFPTKDYKNSIKEQLKSTGLCKVHKNNIDFV